MADLDRIPLTGLRAVEAVGRLGSLARAADELAVTPGAVSQRITKVETLIGRPLFQRLPTGMVPTDLGAEMMVPLSRAIADLARSVAIATEAQTGLLTVTVAPLFAQRWLVWRLGLFQAQHPEIRVRVEPTSRLVDPSRGEVDVGLRAGKGGWPGVQADRLMRYRVFPVCAPGVAPELRQVSDLTRLPIIRENNALAGWEEWLRGTGVAVGDLPDGPVYADAGLCLDVAMTGQGVFLAWESIAQDALERGQVVEPFAPRRVPVDIGLWFVTAPGAERRPAIRQFRRWLQDELAGLAG